MQQTMNQLALGAALCVLTLPVSVHAQTVDAAKAAPTPIAEQVNVARSRWTAACWDSANAATRKRGSYIAVLAFDAAGKLVISGITEVRDSSDPNIAHCLRQHVGDFQLAAGQAPATLEVPFDLP